MLIVLSSRAVPLNTASDRSVPWSSNGEQAGSIEGLLGYLVELNLQILELVVVGLHVLKLFIGSCVAIPLSSAIRPTILPVVSSIPSCTSTNEIPFGALFLAPTKRVVAALSFIATDRVGIRVG